MTTAKSERLDAEALVALHRDYELALLRFVEGITKNREVAADVVQVTFARALEIAGAVNPAARKAWLYRVAFNEALAWRRRQRVEQRAVDRLGRGLTETDPGARPESRLDAAERLHRLDQALEQLNPGEQRVVRLRLADDRTFAEIADELGVPLGTVLTRMRRALAKLRGFLPGDQEDYL